MGAGRAATWATATPFAGVVRKTYAWAAVGTVIATGAVVYRETQVWRIEDDGTQRLADLGVRVAPFTGAGLIPGLRATHVVRDSDLAWKAAPMVAGTAQAPTPGITVAVTGF